jgi:arsenical pump membrane protein
MENSKGIILQKKSLKQWVSVTDLMFVELLLLLTLLIQTKELSLLSLSFVTIVYIVFGEDMDNFLKEVFKPSNANRLSRRFQILFQFITLGTAVRLCRFLRDNQDSVVYRNEGSREWVASILLGIILLTNGLVEFDTIKQVIYEKWEIIGLIMSFALMSYGIGKSGYFKYAAYRITESCGGSTTRLTLYLFVLTSTLTLVTSNDIVILVLTPIIIQIAYYAKIKNAKLLLLSQFVAANTLSMGLLIGSPTNIIFGTVLEYDFLNYIGLMIIPTIMAFMISFIIVHYLNQKHSNVDNGSGWFFDAKYTLPTIDKKQNYTKEMTYWVWSFGFIILLVSIITSTTISLGWTVLGVVFAVVTIYVVSGSPSQRVDHVREHLFKSVKGLPFQIIPFALIFFAITQELSTGDLGVHIGKWIVSSDSYIITTLKSLLVSGGLVNLFNDLPAAAFLSNIIDPNMAGKDMVSRALLVGLNIGCYVTPVGALAGIIWFHQMKNETKKIKEIDSEFDIKTPLRSGLFKYGMIHFVIVTLALSVILPAISHLYNASISPWNGLTYEATEQSMWGIEMLAGVGFAFAIMLVFNHILKSNHVVLGDMRVFLGFMTWANTRNQEHSIGTFILFFVAIVALFTVPIFRAEDWGVSEYIWIPNMIGGGFDFPDELIPKSTLGVILMGILPLASIALLVKLISILSDSKTLEDISLQMATGKIQSHRVVIVGYKEEFMDFIGDILLEKNDVFVTILVESNDKTEVHRFLNDMELPRESYNDYYIDTLPKGDFSDVVATFNIEKADEIYFLSNNEKYKEIAKSMQNRLYLNGSPRLEKNERYPKIFASIGMFDNPHASESYVIEAILDSDFLKKIKMGIYQNNLKNNNFKYLKDLSISS